MSLLAPLYIAGLLALSAPIVLHLIRRTPRGRQAFSSLMFLSPSPPRLTRRSRLDHLLLLLLRAAALALIALAFARPFLRRMEQLDLGAGGQVRTAILLDASASMRREGVWEAAMNKARAAIERAAPDDVTALVLFADAPLWLATFEEVVQTPPGQRRAMLLSRLEQARPTWGAGDLGAALVATADALDSLDAERRDEKASDERLEIVLVGDLAEGADLAALEAYEWPQRVRLSVEETTPRSPGNAGLHLATSELTDAQTNSRQRPSLRVRVFNAADSAQDSFTLRYGDARGLAKDAAAQVQIPPGESRIVRLAPPEKTFDRLVLQGDREPFDNEVFLPREAQAPGSVYYFGEDSPADSSGLLFYLQRAIGGEANEGHRTLQINPSALPASRVSPDSPPFVVVGAPPPSEQLGEIAALLRAGGSVLLTVGEAGAGDATTAAALSQLAGAGEPAQANFEEAQVDDFALLGEIDFSDPLFAPFADPRYGDFTGIHFWRYRRMAASDFARVFPDDSSRVVARFDSGDPALIVKRVGAGRLWTLMTTWRPRDSELARSSKFVPLVWGMVAAGEKSDLRRTVYRVGESIPLAKVSADQAWSVTPPDGQNVTLDAGATSFAETSAPGVYRLTGPAGEREFAVNLAADESRTARLPLEQLESRGVALTGAEQKAEEAAHQRQLLDVELEGRQQAWRWLLVGALVLLVAETILAGRAARKAVAPVPA